MIDRDIHPTTSVIHTVDTLGERSPLSLTVSTISTSSTPSSHSYMKHASLISLTLQNAVSILLLRYVRTLPGPRFINSTAVFSSEIVKTIASVLLLLREEGSVKKGLRLIYEKIKYHPKDTLKTGIPALLYTLQNNLLFIAISNLDAATFQVSFQLKIFTTAMFMVLILNRQLNLSQWLALFLLFLGVSLVQIENMTSTAAKPDVNPVFGMVAVVSACTLSGLAGVYFEKILKGSDVSVWMRNVQLGMFGIFFAFITMQLSDGAEVKSKGYLYGYTPMVWTAIFAQSAGGLIVALVVKHADNILKGFATSLAIILSCVASMIIFDFKLTPLFALGSLLVICSISLYSKPDLIFRIPVINMILKDRSILL